MHQPFPSVLFFHIFSHAREKIWPSETQLVGKMKWSSCNVQLLHGSGALLVAAESAEIYNKIKNCAQRNGDKNIQDGMLLD